ncbi:MAG: DUF805 domain-containing protein [Pseudobacteriovorax sp.]|nr:DUF805 domain-containing protein [Pseudobacteriovorax sp.]
MRYYTSFWKNIFNFKDRSNRKEFFIPYLINILLAFAIVHSARFIMSEGASTIIFVIFLIPACIAGLSATVRRLHDADYSGLLIFLRFIPILGDAILLVLVCLKGTEGANKFGDKSLV